ncbi:MAG: heparinase, partial [Pseudomonadota bacterium]|nr:heparinase [Pseudomonadota bacterium]
MMSAAFRRLFLYINTVRWLRVSQLCWQIFRRFRPISLTAEPPLETLKPIIFNHYFPKRPQPLTYEFRFLNKSKPAAGEDLNWHPKDVSRLWRYNLHYFDFLHWESFSLEQKILYIKNWISNNPIGTADAWEPYTTSIRIVNWIKFFDYLEDEIPDSFCRSLLNQAVWLEKNIEYHILANHLLKNAKAILFAGFVFDGPAGHRLR